MMIGLLIITIVAFGVIVLIMSVGLIFKGRCILRSCGGEEIIGPDGELLNCETCPVRKEHEARLAQDSQGTGVSASR